MTDEQPTRWANRIVGEGWEDPGQLLAHPDNPKIHPTPQQEALLESLSDLGWIQRVLVSQRSGRVIDGHLRVLLAMRHDETQVPVLYVDLSPEEEKKALLMLDPIAGMATVAAEKLGELVSVTKIRSEGLMERLKAMVERGVPELSASEQAMQRPGNVCPKCGHRW